MPIGIYNHHNTKTPIYTLERNKKISISHKGKPSHWRGKHHSKKTKEKLKIANKGQIPWNKGKKGLQVSWWKGRKRPIAFGLRHSKAMRGRPNPFRKGEKNNFWKGGITDLRILIRKSKESRLWTRQIFERDNYTCQECFKKRNKLNSHHKKAFAIIFQDFLQQYSQFSPIEDKETLVRLAITYEPFWDVDNGVTLCIDCHNIIKRKKKIIGGLK